MATFVLVFSFSSFFLGVFCCTTGLGGVTGGSFFTDAGAALAGEAVAALSTGAFSFFTLTEFVTGAFWGVEGGSCFTCSVPLVEGAGFVTGLVLLGFVTGLVLLRAGCFLGG